jgi:hypothetical protein
MELAVHIVPYLIWFPLELLAITGMLRCGYRRYLFVFIYVIADFLTTAVEVPVDLSYYAGNHNKYALNSLINFYWIDEAIMQALVYAAVISLIYYATSTLRSRRILRISLIGFAVLFAGVSFLIHFDPSNPKVGEWTTPWNSNLKFCSAILDMALWGLLIVSREKDHRLLMLSGALGIQFTGNAIGQALRNLALPHHTYWMVYTGDAAVVVFNLAFIYLVWQAFRVVKPKAQISRGAEGCG